MKTSIEWYQKAIFDILKEKENISDEIFLQNMLNAYLQAKEMEKEQIETAFEEGMFHHTNGLCPDEYYNETFKSE